MSENKRDVVGDIRTNPTLQMAALLEEKPKPVDVANEPVEEDEEMFDSGVLHEKRK